MPSVKVYNIQGEEVSTLELNPNVFGLEYNEALIHQVVVAQLANARQGTKSTLTRAEVRGGGIKPWRQKGSGRARQGSIRAPQWIKGGVVFAPKPRDFSQKINKKAKDMALKSALSEKVNCNEFIVLDTLQLEEAKTKNIVAILKNLNVEKKALIVTGDMDANVVRASNNLQKVKATNIGELNVYDLVSGGKCVITLDAVKKLEEVYA